MIKFCRNCGGELTHADDKVCKACGANAVKGNTYCRYCGHPTGVEDATCGYCGASIKPLPGSMRSLFEYPRLSARMGKIINLTLVVVVIVLYVVFTLPKSVKKPVAQAASDAVQASTGYTALPLDHIEITPPRIPQLVVVMFDPQPSVIAQNVTRQLTVYAIYRNSVGENATKAIRAEDVTNNCTYQSSNEKVAVCNATGSVLTKGTGVANITASYTAAPGSANFSNAAAGKTLQTFTAVVGVYVR